MLLSYIPTSEFNILYLKQLNNTYKIESLLMMEYFQLEEWIVVHSNN
jgi:hypothetical protein